MRLIVMVLPTPVVLALIFAFGIVSWGIYDIWGHTQLKSVAPERKTQTSTVGTETDNAEDALTDGAGGSDEESLGTPGSGGQEQGEDVFPVSPVEVGRVGESEISELHQRQKAPSSPYSTISKAIKR